MIGRVHKGWVQVWCPECSTWVGEAAVVITVDGRFICDNCAAIEQHRRECAERRRSESAADVSA